MASKLQVVEDDFEDIDPSAWLADQESPTGYFYPYADKKSRLKIAAITQEEQQSIVNASKKINPTNPKGDRVVDSDRYTLNLIAFSLNKASGKTVNDHGYIVPNDQRLRQKLAGDLQRLFRTIVELSGFTDDDHGPDPKDFSVGD